MLPMHFMCYQLKLVHNRCMHIGNHVIKVLYGQFNIKYRFLVHALVVIAATIVQTMSYNLSKNAPGHII